MRVKPTALVGIAIWLVYAVIVVVMQKTSGIPYTDFGDSTANMWRGVIPSLFVGSVVIAAIAVFIGWWGPAIRDKNRTRIGWTLIAPVLYLVVALGNLATTDWGSISAGFVLVAVVLGVLVGFAEEIVCRGLLLVGLRANFQEVGVWALTCVLFGLMHGVNIFLGASIGPTVTQILMAGMQGSAFYILRRYFGTLVFAMALHGFWDMSIFVQNQSGVTFSLVSVLIWPAAILSLVGGFVVARRTDPVEEYAKGSAAPVLTA